MFTHFRMRRHLKLKLCTASAAIISSWVEQSSYLLETSRVVFFFPPHSVSLVQYSCLSIWSIFGETCDSTAFPVGRAKDQGRRRRRELWILRADGFKGIRERGRGETSYVCVSPSDRKSERHFSIRILPSFGVRACIDPFAPLPRLQSLSIPLVIQSWYFIHFFCTDSPSYNIAQGFEIKLK